MTLPDSIRSFGNVRHLRDRRRSGVAGQVALSVLPAPGSQAATPVDFRDSARLIGDGYRLTVEWLGHMTQAQAGPSAARPQAHTAFSAS